MVPAVWLLVLGLANDGVGYEVGSAITFGADYYSLREVIEAMGGKATYDAGRDWVDIRF